MRRENEDTFRAWAISQTLLVGLLGAGLALFVSNPVLRTTWQLPEARLVLDTLVALAATLVAALAGVRFSVEGRKLDLMLCSGFTVLALGTACLLDRPRARRSERPADGGLGAARLPPPGLDR